MTWESISRLSELTGTSYRTVKKRCERLPSMGEGRAIKYESKDALPLIISSETPAGEESDESPDLFKQRARLARAQADAQELKNQEAAGQFIAVDAVVESIADIASQVAAILEGLPMKVKKAQPGLSAFAIETIKREVAKARNAAAEIRLVVDNDKAEA